MREPELTGQFNIDLEYLGNLIGKHQSETSSDPARLILIGKASAEITALKITEKAYHIDVVLDLRDTDERLALIRRCMRQARVFREFYELKKTSETFFGTNEHRGEVFDDVVGENKSVHKGKHLEAYVMDPERAFEFELRRWAEEGSDENITSIKIALAIWRGNTASRDKAPSCSSPIWRYLRYIRADTHVPEISVRKVCGKTGIVKA